MFSEIGAVVAGTGMIGPIHIEALKRLGVTVHGVLGSNPDKSKAAARAIDVPRGYDSLDEVLDDPNVDVVHLAVPNRLHYPMVVKVLDAGKHVLCEKPLAMTVEESSRLVEHAKKTGLEAGVCYNIRFYPMNLEAGQKRIRGELGSIYSVVGSYVQDWLYFDTDYNWRVLAEQGGELRAVGDIGTHWMDLVSTITGLRIEAVCADLKTVHSVRRRPMGEVQTFAGKLSKETNTEPIDITTEDSAVILVRFDGGAHGSLWVSQVTAGRKNCLRYEIAGSKSTVAWNSEEPNHLWVGSREKANEDIMKDPSLLTPEAAAFANFPGGHSEGFPDTFKQCFKSFYTSVLARKGRCGPPPVPYPTFEQGDYEVRLCEAILESHRTEKWVTVD